MLPQDGDYSIYVVEFKSLDTWSNAIEFLRRLPSHLVSPPIMTRQDRARFLKILDGFSANGKCWQETRIHGTYDMTGAGTAMMLCCRFFKDEEFRVVCVDISQKTDVMVSSVPISPLPIGAAG